MFSKYLLVGAYSLLGILLSTGSNLPRSASNAGPAVGGAPIRAEEDDGTSEEDDGTSEEDEEGIYDEDEVLA